MSENKPFGQGSLPELTDEQADEHRRTGRAPVGNARDLSFIASLLPAFSPSSVFASFSLTHYTTISSTMSLLGSPITFTHSGKVAPTRSLKSVRPSFPHLPSTRADPHPSVCAGHDRASLHVRQGGPFDSRKAHARVYPTLQDLGRGEDWLHRLGKHPCTSLIPPQRRLSRTDPFPSFLAPAHPFLTLPTGRSYGSRVRRQRYHRPQVCLGVGPGCGLQACR